MIHNVRASKQGERLKKVIFQCRHSLWVRNTQHLWLHALDLCENEASQQSDMDKGKAPEALLLTAELLAPDRFQRGQVGGGIFASVIHPLMTTPKSEGHCQSNSYTEGQVKLNELQNETNPQVMVLGLVGMGWEHWSGCGEVRGCVKRVIKTLFIWMNCQTTKSIYKSSWIYRDQKVL